MKKALVLGGGGAKGAYEIGVWKALREMNITVDIVTGTSIGALIGAMVVQDDFVKAYDLWDHMDASQVIQDGISFDFDMELLMSQRSQLKQLLRSYVNHRGADIAPFKEMIDAMFDAEAFFASPIDYGCMCVCLDPIAPTAFTKSQFNEKLAQAYLLASASCFPAFPMQVIEGKRYVDGGYADNVPISLARTLGAEEMIAVDLKYKLIRPETTNHLTYITPHVALGSFLDFTSATIHRNMRLGYLDTLKQYHQYYGYIYTFGKNDIDKIQAFEDVYQHYLQKFAPQTKPLVSRFFQQLIERSLLRTLKEYESYSFPYLRILEDCGQIFDMDDEIVYAFQEYVTGLLHRYDTMTHPVDTMLSSKLSVKELAKEIKDDRQTDIIYYLYQRLALANQQDRADLSYLSVVFKKEYIAALTIFVLKTFLKA